VRSVARPYSLFSEHEDIYNVLVRQGVGVSLARRGTFRSPRSADYPYFRGGNLLFTIRGEYSRTSGVCVAYPNPAGLGVDDSSFQALSAWYEELLESRATREYELKRVMPVDALSGEGLLVRAEASSGRLRTLVTFLLPYGDTLYIVEIAGRRHILRRMVRIALSLVVLEDDTDLRFQRDLGIAFHSFGGPWRWHEDLDDGMVLRAQTAFGPILATVVRDDSAIALVETPSQRHGPPSLAVTAAHTAAIDTFVNNQPVRLVLELDDHSDRVSIAETAFFVGDAGYRLRFSMPATAAPESFAAARYTELAQLLLQRHVRFFRYEWGEAEPVEGGLRVR
jgi:hypothetical protein